MRSACFFWPGSEAKIAGYRPTYYLHFDDKIDDEARIAQVLAWLQLPEDVRPHFITLYYSEPDHEGHEFGPDAPETHAAMLQSRRPGWQAEDRPGRNRTAHRSRRGERSRHGEGAGRLDHARPVHRSRRAFETAGSLLYPANRSRRGAHLQPAQECLARVHRLPAQECARRAELQRKSARGRSGGGRDRPFCHPRAWPAGRASRIIRPPWACTASIPTPCRR